ncbi:MAG: hypothetical protein U0414_09290 [Polyangiaceae bacterium]
MIRRSLAVLALVGASCAPAAIVDTTPTGTGIAKPSAAPPKPGPAANTLVKVVYKDDWFGAVELVGVDAAGAHAVVRLAHPSPERVYLDTLDLATAQRSARWELADGPAEHALAGRGFPTDESIRAEVARFAELLVGLGPWHTRPALPSPTFAAGTDGALFVFGAKPPDGASVDWLYAMGKQGAPKRIDDRMRASYSPVVAPSNDLVAFRGCESTPCDYGAYLTQIGGGTRRVLGIAKSTPPVFTLDGASLLSVGDGDAAKRERCVFRANVDGKKAAEKIACVHDLNDVAFTQDPESKTGVLSGGSGRSSEQLVTFTWIDLATGKVLGAESIPRATGTAILGKDGLLALPMQKGGIAFADLAHQRFVVLPEEENWFFGFEAARFVGDDLILLRKPEGVVGYEIVRLAARTLVDVLGRSAADAAGTGASGFIPPSN